MIREICGHYLLDNVRNKIQAVLGRLNKWYMALSIWG
jgi:hypothetical protein